MCEFRIDDVTTSQISHNQQKKDQREWAILRLFRSSFTSFPIGKVNKSECPDFILLTNGGRKIGIELTELKYERDDLEFNLRAHEDFLTDIMHGAQQIVEKETSQKLIVDVHFKDELGPSISVPRDRRSMLLSEGFTESIAKIVLDNIPNSTGKEYLIDRTSKYGDLNLPSKIEEIRVRNMTGRYEEGLWYAGISTKIKPMSIESITDRIKDKDEKIVHYEPSDENWLLIIQNSFLMSSRYNSRDVQFALSHTYDSKFDRIFVFERIEGTVSELKINRIK